MTVIAGWLLLIALVCWTLGVLRLVHWLLDRRDARIESDNRAADLIAQAREEVRRG